MHPFIRSSCRCKNPNGDPQPCAGDVRASMEKECAVIKDETSVFRNCIRDPKASASMFYENCVYDGCANNGGEAVCRSLEAFATACRDLGYVVNWRQELDRCRE
jgi:hypothetical protein